MTRAERKARLARQAVVVLARQAAKNAVRAHIRAQGWKLWDFTSKDIALWADVWLAENPELISQAKVTAVELGFAQPNEKAKNDDAR
jgi:hypothetical protein